MEEQQKNSHPGRPRKHPIPDSDNVILYDIVGVNGKVYKKAYVPKESHQKRGPKLSIKAKLVNRLKDMNDEQIEELYNAALNMNVPTIEHPQIKRNRGRPKKVST